MAISALLSQNTGAGGSSPPAPAAAPPPISSPPRRRPALPKLPAYDPRVSFKSDAERDEWGRKLVAKIDHSLMQLVDRHDLIRSYRDQYEATSYPKSTPWPNAANLNIPTTRAAVDTVHSDIVGAMTGTTPLFRTEAFTQADEADAMAIEQILEWQVRDQANLPSVWDTLVKGALIDGTGIAEVCWRKEAARTRKPGHVLGKDGLPKIGADGQPVAALVEETEYVVNQPDIIPHDILDFAIYPVLAKSIPESIGCGVRIWLTKDDLLRGVRDGLYDEEQVGKLLKNPPEQPMRQAEQYGGDDGRDSRAGLDSAEALDAEDRAYQFFKVIWRYDEDGDGICEDCLFIVEMSTATMIRAETYPYWHMRRCFVDYTPIPREGHFYGYAVPEMIQSLHEERNAIRNQRVDAGTLYLSPVLAAKRGVKFDLNKQRWRPGAILHMDDPVNDVRPVSFQNVSQTAFAEEQKVQENVESLLGVSEYSMGSSPSRSRTVGEISQVSASGNKRIDTMIMRLHLANNEVANQIVGLDAQFLDAETEYSITRDGARVFQTLDKSQLRTRVRIQAQGNTVNSNKEMRLQSNETLFQMMQNTPIMQKPTRVYAVLTGYLQAMGIINVVPFIGTEDEAKQMEAKQEQQGPPPPPPPAISGKMDDTLVLAWLMQNNELSPQCIEQAANMSQQFQLGNAAISTLATAATAAHGAETETKHHVMRTAATRMMTPQAQQEPGVPPAAASASPMPPATQGAQ
jgi:hypothetical protein